MALCCLGETYMEVRDRTDATLDDGSKYTWKHMENDEHRRRTVFSNGLSVSSTELAHYEVSDEKLPWQGGHHHRGKMELYFLISGWAAFVWTDVTGVHWEILRDPTDTISFLQGCDHNVLLGPNSHIGTAIFGEPIGNPERKGNDWWPAPNNFDETTFEAKSQAVGELRQHGLL